MTITVNGAVVAQNVSFPPTTNWTTWQTVTVPMTLPSGTNKIKATATTPNGGPNVDRITA
jgi:exo-1,4-beta-D-glucosaminidase